MLEQPRASEFPKEEPSNLAQDRIGHGGTVADAATLVANLRAEICSTLGARIVAPQGVDFVREFLIESGHTDLLQGIDDLATSLESLGCDVEMQFAQIGTTIDGKFKADVSSTPIAILTATKETDEGTRYYVPDINLVLNPIELRGRQPDPANGQKSLMTGVGHEYKTPRSSSAYPISLEEYTHPVQLVVRACSGEATDWSESDGAALPFEMLPAFSQHALTEGFEHLDSAVGQGGGAWYERRKPEGYSFVLTELVQPYLSLHLNKFCSPEVGRREPVDIVQAVVDPLLHQAVVETEYPLQGETVPISLAVEVKSRGAFVAVKVRDVSKLSM